MKNSTRLLATATFPLWFIPVALFLCMTQFAVLFLEITGVAVRRAWQWMTDGPR
jgi:hypothetical protein